MCGGGEAEASRARSQRSSGPQQTVTQKLAPSRVLYFFCISFFLLFFLFKLFQRISKWKPQALVLSPSGRPRRPNKAFHS
jgi:hypothetical protein